MAQGSGREACGIFKICSWPEAAPAAVPTAVLAAVLAAAVAAAVSSTAGAGSSPTAWFPGPGEGCGSDGPIGY